MRSAHVRRIIAEGDVVDILVDLLPAGDLREGLHDSVDILVQPLFADERIDLLHRLAGAQADILRVLVRNGLSGEFIDFLDEFGKQDAPRGIDRDDVLSVDDRDARADLIIEDERRNEVDTHDARPFRVQRCVVNLGKILFRVIKFAFCCSHLVTSRRGRFIQIPVYHLLREYAIRASPPAKLLLIEIFINISLHFSHIMLY